MRHSFFKQIPRSRIQRRHAHPIQRPGFIFIIIRIIEQPTAVFSASSKQHRPEGNAASDIISPASLNAEQAFMSGKSYRIRHPAVHVHRNTARALRKIHDQQQMMFSGNPADFPHILDAARHIRTMIHHQDPAFSRNIPLQHFRMHLSVPVTGHHRRRSLNGWDIIERPEHAVVLRSRYDHLRCRNPQSIKNFIKRLRGTGRKINAFRLPYSKKRPQFLPTLCKYIRRSRIGGASELSRRNPLKKNIACVLYTLRLGISSCRVIQINHFRPPACHKSFHIHFHFILL